MIAQRFRALGWAAGIAAASTGLYLISLQVAAERAKLEAVDGRISAAQRDMQRLKTELSTRASYRQLEKWNDEDLAMAAPTAAQYFKSETQLASLSPDSLAPATETLVPRAQLAAATVKAVAPTPAAPVAEQAAPEIRHANFVPTASTIVGGAKTQRVSAVASTDAPAKPQRIAAVARPALDKDFLGDLSKAADKERRVRP
ncbi:MAG: hypothetical protein V4530_00800 [Pseudomonadota bacterium]